MINQAQWENDGLYKKLNFNIVISWEGKTGKSLYHTFHVYIYSESYWDRDDLTKHDSNIKCMCNVILINNVKPQGVSEKYTYNICKKIKKIM
jgi:hypothetical protein